MAEAFTERWGKRKAQKVGVSDATGDMMPLLGLRNLDAERPVTSSIDSLTACETPS